VQWLHSSAPPAAFFFVLLNIILGTCIWIHLVIITINHYTTLIILKFVFRGPKRAASGLEETTKQNSGDLRLMFSVCVEYEAIRERQD
jgi:hypothetical protein